MHRSTIRGAALAAALAAGAFVPMAHAVAAPQPGAVDEFPIALDQFIGIDDPGSGAGTIEDPGSMDVYTFSIDGPTSVYFDSIEWSASDLRVEITDPDGAVVWDNWIFNDAGRIELTVVGTYATTVYGSGDATGTYEYTAWSVDDDGPVEIGFEQLITLDDPYVGAGNIEEPGNLDVYTFTVDAPVSVYFDAQAWSSSELRVQILDPSGDELWDNWIFNDLGRTDLSELGQYTLTVYGSGDGTGTYDYFIWVVQDKGPIPIELEQTIAPDDPVPGAGTIEEPGATDVYVLSIDAPLTVYFDSLAWSNSNLRVEVLDPSGGVVWDDWIFSDAGRTDLDVVGEYTITVHGNGDATGTYEYIIWTVDDDGPAAVDLEQLITLDDPYAGAGNIEEPGNEDRYTFTIDEPTTVYFDGANWSSSNLRVEILDPSGAEVWDNWIFSDAGRTDLDVVGEYTIAVYGNGDATGTYEYVIWEVDDDGPVAIALEQAVALDDPIPGAGHIEEPGNRDVYTFSIDEPTTVYFDGVDWSSSNLRVEVLDPAGELFTDNWIFDDAGRTDLTVTGEYTITVYARDSTVGTYEYIVWEVDDDAFTIATGELVEPGSPGPGAGHLEDPGNEDHYSIDLEAGSVVCFDVIDYEDSSIRWLVTDPDGSLVFDRWIFQTFGPYEVGGSGTWSILVYGRDDQTGTYAVAVIESSLADLNGDCYVDTVDLLQLLSVWGPCDDPKECPEDLDGDGAVGVTDLLQLLSAWTVL